MGAPDIQGQFTIGVITLDTPVPYEGPIARSLSDKPQCTADLSGWGRIGTEAERLEVVVTQVAAFGGEHPAAEVPEVAERVAAARVAQERNAAPGQRR
ncbi:MAG: hypothetical protein AAF569_02205 [Pseudomonadota bacterium]